MIHLRNSVFRFGLPFLAVACLSPTLKPGAGAVALLFQSDDISQCRLVAKIDTGQTVIRSFQDAQIILRNTAFDMGANSIRIYRFEPNKRGYAEALICKDVQAYTPAQRKKAQKRKTAATEPQKTKKEESPVKTAALETKTNANTTLSGETFPRGTLLWRRCGYGQYFAKGTCVGKNAMLDWRAALKYCQSLNAKAKVWRLPSPAELQSLLVKQKDGGAMINRRAFPNTAASLYWTDKRYDGSRNVAWTVDFKSGSSFAFGIQNKAYVRCVTER